MNDYDLTESNTFFKVNKLNPIDGNLIVFQALGILNMDFLCQALDDHEAIQFINAGHGDFHHHHGGSQRRRKHLSSGGGNGSSIEHSQ